MHAVVLTIHTLIVLALIGIVLLQRSEGGALGIGGGGPGGGFMTGRGTATALTRTTSILAALFFATSMGLAIFADRGESEQLLMDELTGAPAQRQSQEPAGPASVDDLLRTLGADEDAPARAAPRTEPEAGEPPALDEPDRPVGPAEDAAPAESAPAASEETAPAEDAPAEPE